MYHNPVKKQENKKSILFTLLVGGLMGCGEKNLPYPPLKNEPTVNTRLQEKPLDQSDSATLEERAQKLVTKQAQIKKDQKKAKKQKRKASGTIKPVIKKHDLLHKVRNNHLLTDTKTSLKKSIKKVNHFFHKPAKLRLFHKKNSALPRK